MASKKNYSSKIDPEQRELIERAQQRAKKRKRLYLHFIIFLVGAVILILLNAIFEIGQNINPFGIDWFVWAIMIWAILLLVHVFNFFVTDKFMGKDWEETQVDRLVAKQQKRIAELENQVERDHPLPRKDEPYVAPTKEKPIDRDSPLNT